MENKKINVEEIIKNDLHQYLTSIDRVDQHLPEALIWSNSGQRLERAICLMRCGNSTNILPSASAGSCS